MLAIALIGLLLSATVSFRFALLVTVPAVALTWLFVTVQLTLVRVPACAGELPRAITLPLIATINIKARRAELPISVLPVFRLEA